MMKILLKVSVLMIMPLLSVRFILKNLLFQELLSPHGNIDHYKKFHSTESALLMIHNDIVWEMEKQGVTVLVLLDHSSAFDTIDHMVLLARLDCNTVLE